MSLLLWFVQACAAAAVAARLEREAGGLFDRARTLRTIDYERADFFYREASAKQRIAQIVIDRCEP